MEKIAEALLAEYQHLQTLLEHISVLLHGARHSEREDDVNHTRLASAPTELNRENPDNLTIDSLAIAITTQLLQEVKQIYENGHFHETWKMLTDFCEQDIRFYVRAIEARDPTTLHAAHDTLTQISITLLQHFAPLTPFLAEHFYRLIFCGQTKQITTASFKRIGIQCRLGIRQSLKASRTKKNDAKTEWEAT